MNTITREIIHKDFIIFSENTTITYNNFIKDIDQAKNYLSNKGLIKGNKVLLCVNEWPKFLVWFFACAELGLILVTVDYKNLSDEKKAELYHDIQLELSNNDSYDTSPNIPIAIKVTPNDTLIYSFSSGTTDNCKLVGYTHSMCFALMNRNAKIYNLIDDDVCLHTKGLEHGSIINVYLLPTIKYCKHHYYATSDSWNTHISYITRCLLFYDMVDSLNEYPSLNHLTIYTLSKIDDDTIAKLKNAECNLYSIFGCIETSGPIFLPALPINQNNFGQLLDDYYTVYINDSNMLTVITPEGLVVETGDYFEIINNNHYYYGRHQHLLSPIISQLEQLNLVGQKDFDIVIDSLYNKIYLRLDQQLNIDLVRYNIAAVVIQPRSKFMYGIKFDASNFRNYCRSII